MTRTRFPEKQRSVLWQEINNGKVDVMICLNEATVEVEDGATEYEYDCTTFRALASELDRNDVVNNPENYSDYVPTRTKTTEQRIEALEQLNDELAKQNNELASQNEILTAKSKELSDALEVTQEAIDYLLFNIDDSINDEVDMDVDAETDSTIEPDDGVAIDDDTTDEGVAVETVTDTDGSTVSTLEIVDDDTIIDEITESVDDETDNEEVDE